MKQVSPSTKIAINYRRLMSVSRCSNFEKIYTEDVAEHSFYVTLLSNIIANEYNAGVRYDMFDVSLVTEKALYHDIEESFFSDIPRNIKHDNDNINRAIEDVVSSKLDKIYAGTSEERYIDMNRHAKDGFEGELVDMADIIELAIYCCEEITKGNRLMEPLLDKCISIAKSKLIFGTLYKYSNTFSDIFDMISSDDMCDIYINAINID